MVSETTAANSGTSRSRGLNITLWVLQALLALQFAMAGLSKLGGQDSMVQMFDDIGAGQWFRYVTGSLELAGAIALLIPLLSGVAALALSVFMACATVSTIAFLDDPVVVPIIVMVFCIVVAWGRLPETRALLARFRS